MDLSKVSNHELVGRLEQLAVSERKITHLILWHIIEMDARKLYADLGFDSMYSYLTRKLGYSEDAAYRRMNAARLLKQAPALSDKIAVGSVTLTQLAQVQKCLKVEKKSGNEVSVAKTLQVIEQIQNKSSFETQKVLAVEFNQPIQTHETVKPQRDDTVRMELILTSEQMDVLAQAKDLLTHVLPDPTWAELITHLAQLQIKKIKGSQDGGLKAQSTQRFLVARKIRPRKAIQMTLKRELLKKAGHQCEFINPETKQKCCSRYQLQIDHRIPVAIGGSNETNNLRVLCRQHNLLMAKKWNLLR